MRQEGFLDRFPRQVLDASALLAQLHGESGADVVDGLTPRSVVSSVNWAEVVQKVIARGSLKIYDVRLGLESAGLRILPFEADDAHMAAELWAVARPAGLSLGDRACLSLAQRLGLPAVTADRRWATLDLPVEVRLIR